MHKESLKAKGENTKIQGDDAMSNGVMSYTALDLNALGKKNVKVVSSKEALSDVSPIKWEEDILQGRKKITVARRENEE
ncbi:MAG: hypothetical protein HFG42_13185 [Lachnospiraceae bacterium]|nr:hypothetical protein [Lachnospiraceae bacterium]